MSAISVMLSRRNYDIDTTVRFLHSNAEFNLPPQDQKQKINCLKMTKQPPTWSSWMYVWSTIETFPSL